MNTESAAKERRCKRPRVISSALIGEDCEAILEILTEPPKRSRWRPVCILASRIQGSHGQIIASQSFNNEEPQVLRRADEALGETLHFKLAWRGDGDEDNTLAPSWVPSHEVPQKFVDQYEHLLHVYPSLQEFTFGQGILIFVSMSTHHLQTPF